MIITKISGNNYGNLYDRHRHRHTIPNLHITQGAWSAKFGYFASSSLMFICNEI